MPKAKPRVVKDFSRVRVVKTNGQKPLPANDPVLLDMIKKATTK